MTASPLDATGADASESRDRPVPVDVVISTRNRPDMLREAVASVLAQDYAGEVRCHVVFDRCDPDPVVATLADGLPRRSVRSHENTRTGGLAGGRNSGVLEGEAPLIGFCDDDDLWAPRKLTLQVEALRRRPEALSCVTGIVVEYADHSVPRVPSAADVSHERLVRHRVMEAHPSSVLVRREAFLGPIGMVDEEIPGSYGEDWDWILRAAEAGPIAVAEEPLVHVRWGSSQFSRKWQLIIDSIDYMLAKHPAFERDRRAHARQLGRRAFALAASGQRGALAEATHAVRRWPTDRRAWLAAAVALHLVSADRLMDLAHRRGRGI